MPPDILGEGARPGPQAISPVILDEADLDVANVPGEALELHPGDVRLSPFDDAHEGAARSRWNSPDVLGTAPLQRQHEQRDL